MKSIEQVCVPWMCILAHMAAARAQVVMKWLTGLARPTWNPNVAIFPVAAPDCGPGDAEAGGLVVGLRAMAPPGVVEGGPENVLRMFGEMVPHGGRQFVVAGVGHRRTSKKRQSACKPGSVGRGFPRT